MKSNQYSPTSDFIFAYEFAKKGKYSAAREALKQSNNSDEILMGYFERGEGELAIQYLETRLESAFKLTELTEREEDRSELFSKLYKMYSEKNNSSYPGLSIRANSPALVPLDQQRTLTVAGVPAAVETKLRIDLMQFRSRNLPHQKLGVTVEFPEDGSKIAIPTETTAIPIADIIEGAVVGTPADPEWLSSVVSTVYTVNAAVLISRRFYTQFGELGNEMFKDRLNFEILKAVNIKMFRGTGADGQPTGILNNADVPSISGASFTRDIALQMKRTVLDQEPPEGLSYALGPQTEELLSKRQLASGSDKYIIQDGKLNGEPYVSDKSIGEGTIYYGHFGTVYIPLWPRIIRFDPFIGVSSNIRVDEWQDYDIMIRKPNWLIKATGVN